MQNKIIIALRRKYHCDYVRMVMMQNALSYPVYEIGENDISLSRVRRAIDQGAEILITGDVYAESIMKQIDISVVTIRRSKIPFATAFREALALDKRAAIIWRDSDSSAVKKACAGYPDAISFFPYQNPDELASIFEKLRQEEFHVVIGTGLVNPYAEQAGMAVVNVPYDETDILSAVRMAEHNLHILEGQKEQAEIFQIIQDNIAEGIISITTDGSIQTINLSASKILHLDARTVQGLPISKTPVACEEIDRMLTSFEAFSEKMLTIGGNHFVLEGQPILVHDVFKSALLTLVPVENLQHTEQQIRKQLLGSGRKATVNFHDIIGRSKALTDCIRIAEQYAKVDSSVLVYGQSGTGKEMFVQSIHNASRRRNGPFVVINCAALPENLIESELFGYEKGAFTGALSSGKQGLFVQGHQGTVFLDEVSEMPLHVQARFLRVLQEHEVTPVGSLRVIPVDIRVIAATNKDLKKMVEEKKFREDLYYRISVLSMTLPPLKERGNDTELLIRHFIKQKNKELKLNIQHVEPAALSYLCSLPYPGNIRQLSNIVERAMVLSPESTLDLSSAVSAVTLSEGFSAPDVLKNDGGAASLAGIDSLHEELIRDALKRNKNRRKETAEELGISTSTLYRKMKQFGIEI